MRPAPDEASANVAIACIAERRASATRVFRLRPRPRSPVQDLMLPFVSPRFRAAPWNGSLSGDAAPSPYVLVRRRISAAERSAVYNTLPG
jgi:hypothetical protein